MTIMTQDTGALAILKAYFNNVFPTSKDLTLKLFSNDITPADDDVLTDYTIPTGGGYADITLTNGSWTASIVSDVAQVAYAVQRFTFTGALDSDASIYGYLVVDDNDDVVFSEALSTPVTPVDNGNYVDVTPIYKLSKGTPS